jgi:hypothetical protein
MAPRQLTLASQLSFFTTNLHQKIVKNNFKEKDCKKVRDRKITICSIIKKENFFTRIYFPGGS